jgi:hypothetical protein
MTRRTIATLMLITLLAAFFVKPASAQSNQIQESIQSDQALCVPGVSEFESLNCEVAGPAQRLREWEKLGLTFPEEAVSLVNPPYDLFYIPFSYAKVVDEAVFLYASVDDAMNKTPIRTLAAGKIKYISYTQREETTQGTFYRIATGEWINGSVITKVSVPYYQGYLINDFPYVPFGWVLTNDAVSYTAPGYASQKTNNSHYRFEMIHFYDTETIDGTEWVMIGPNEWMEHRFLGIVFNNPTPPEGVTNNRWIEVNLYEQVLTVYDQGQMVFATLISSGVDPFFTQPGVFQVYEKYESGKMSGAFEADRSDYYYLEEVPYILYYDEARALHGAYWNTLYGYQRSHGCVNLSVGDAHWLYDWAVEGDYVYVWDPSGLTPTDPSYYGLGGF